MSKKTSTHFCLIITAIGLLGLVGSACSRSTMTPHKDPAQGSEPTVDGGPAETIEPGSDDTGNDNAATGPIDMGEADAGTTAEDDRSSNDPSSPDSPDSPDSNDEPAGTTGGTATTEETPEGSSEPPADGPTFGDDGGGIPYDPGQEGSSNFRMLPSGEVLRHVTAARTPGSVNVFFRNHEGHLCRTMGPPELAWNSENSQTACFNAYTIDRPPQVAFDPNRRKIYAFAPDVTGDLGQAHGFRFYVCEADSIRCTASTHLLWESKFHFYPALVFVKGATPAQDRIVGFSHAGDGGRLAYFVVDPNPESLRHHFGYVGPKLLDGASRSACGEWASIDRSPTAFFHEDEDGQTLHVMARNGDQDLLHLQVFSRYLTGFTRDYWARFGGSEGDVRFHCRKISETYQGRDGLGNMGTQRRGFALSPSAVWRGGDTIDVFGGVKSHDFSSTGGRLWSIWFNDVDSRIQKASWLNIMTRYEGGVIESNFDNQLAANLSYQLAFEERLTVVKELATPNSTVHLIANVQQQHVAEGTEPEITLHGRIGPAGEPTTLETLPFRFGGQPAAVTDDQGNLHVFGASYDAGPTGHFRLLHAARPLDESHPWEVFRTAAGRYIQKGGRGSGESGVTAVWVPGTSFFLGRAQ